MSATPEIKPGLYEVTEKTGMFYVMSFPGAVSETKNFRPHYLRPGEIVFMTKVRRVTNVRNYTITYEALVDDKVMVAYWNEEAFHRTFKKIDQPSYSGPP